jgi:hypothetical protein
MVHAAQVPLLQTMSVPHTVPLGLLFSMHIGPVVHDIVPVLQTLTTTHAAPWVQPVQAPPEQT